MFTAGTIEYSRLILLTQKLQSSSFILADLTARDRTLTVAQLDNIFLALDNIIQPFPFASDGRAIVTSVGYSAVTKKPIVNWQRTGAGTLVAKSEVGEAGKAATLPAESRHRRRRDHHLRRGLLRLQAALRHRAGAADDPQGRLLQAPPRLARHPAALIVSPPSPGGLQPAASRNGRGQS